MLVGTKILPTTKSKHNGQKGEVIADYGNYLVIKPDNQTYSKAYKNTNYDFKVFQIDSRFIKIIK